MRVGLVISIFVLCVAAALVAHYEFTPPPVNIVVAPDLSGSVQRNCAGFVAESRRLITQAGIDERSTLTLLAMGKSRLDPEPVRAFDQAVPVEPDVIFGKDEAGFERQQQAFFAGLQKSCEAAARSKDSPVLRLVTSGIAHLRSRGCGADGRCVLLLRSDMEDDSDPRLGEIIRRVVKTPTVALPAELAGSVDNAGIRVEACGISEVGPRGNAKHATPETLTRLWMGLFTHPELVSFQPYCGR